MEKAFNRLDGHGRMKWCKWFPSQGIPIMRMHLRLGLIVVLAAVAGFALGGGESGLGGRGDAEPRARIRASGLRGFEQFLQIVLHTAAQA